MNQHHRPTVLRQTVYVAVWLLQLVAMTAPAWVPIALIIVIAFSGTRT